MSLDAIDSAGPLRLPRGRPSVRINLAPAWVPTVKCRCCGGAIGPLKRSGKVFDSKAGCHWRSRGVCSEPSCRAWALGRSRRVAEILNALDNEHCGACVGCRRPKGSWAGREDAEACFCSPDCEENYFRRPLRLTRGLVEAAAVARAEVPIFEVGRNRSINGRSRGPRSERGGHYPFVKAGSALQWFPGREEEPEQEWPAVHWRQNKAWWREPYLQRARGGRVGHLLAPSDEVIQ